MRIIVYFVVLTLNIAVATYTFVVAIKLGQVTESWVGIAIMAGAGVLNVLSAANMIDAIKEVIKSKG